MSFEHCIFDIEGDGLLQQITKVHCLWIEDDATGETLDFACNEERDDIEEGLAILEKAEVMIGHNISSYDLPAIKIVYPDFDPQGIVRDTLVMARMCFADVKESDLRKFIQGKMEGKEIGNQGLRSWGMRLGLHKGDYSHDMEAILKKKHKDENLNPPTKEEHRIHTWGTWNQEMHDYCGLDVQVTSLLWEKIIDAKWSEEATILEHNIHALMFTQEQSGFFFDKGRAEKLANIIREDYDRLAAEAVDEIGIWFRPVRYRSDEDKILTKWGEHNDRRTWGDMTFPKQTRSYTKSSNEYSDEGLYKKMRGDTVEGCPFVKVNLQTFNPNSRQQITVRFRTLWGWEPQDFTEKGNVRVDDEILRNLIDDIPIAETLAEIFFLKKRLSQIADGDNAWLHLLGDDGALHGRVNVGGTVSGRGAHAGPNVSQVPAVELGDTKDAAKAVEAAKLLGISLSKLDYNEDKGEWSWVKKGREGRYGWECRECFIVRPGYSLVGSDLKGIEFRCLAELTNAFDGGELIGIVLGGDIHAENARLTGIHRTIAKRLLYAVMYGGGDAKLGSIVEPLSSEARQRTLGKQLRAKLMKAMPALKEAIRAIHAEMRRNGNTIAGLDGRRLFVRSKHSALNLRLQSDGAIIAKKWCLAIDDAFYDEGWAHHVDAEYAFCAWSHDEVQIAVRDDLAERAALLMKNVAPTVGQYFKFVCPIEAESKIGANWAETH